MIGYITIGTNDLQKALKLGGTDEGPAGLREENYYAGYFRDLDGNKLSVFSS
jgi:predicted lactoylglutathione lyase